MHVQGKLSVERMCQLGGISRSGFYRMLHASVRVMDRRSFKAMPSADGVTTESSMD